MRDYTEAATAWLYHLVGIVMLWLQNHGLGIVGLFSVCFGMWLQWKRHKREERESDARVAAMLRAGR